MKQRLLLPSKVRLNPTVPDSSAWCSKGLACILHRLLATLPLRRYLRHTLSFAVACVRRLRLRSLTFHITTKECIETCLQVAHPPLIEISVCERTRNIINVKVVWLIFVVRMSRIAAFRSSRQVPGHRHFGPLLLPPRRRSTCLPWKNSTYKDLCQLPWRFRRKSYPKSHLCT
jgi:hypothetical protein